jgi:microcystin-dependent protein
VKLLISILKIAQILLYFDVDTDWGLGTKSQVQNIGITVKDWQPGGQVEEDWDIHLETQAAPTVPVEGLSAPYWVLTHQNVTEPRLAAGHTIQITLKIQSFSSSLGQTNLYLRYENIPGYWDGTFVCAIEKSPVLFDSNGNVGIGISNPKNKLDIKGAAVIGNTYAGTTTAPANGLLVDGNVGIGISNPKNKLDVKGGAVVGNTYAGSRTADANSLLVEGTVTATKFVGEGAFVTGMIIMWSGSVDQIPTGWALCDGKNNTPDLSGKFIVGYKKDDTSYGKIGNAGGAETVTLTESQIPSHSHSGKTDTQQFNLLLGAGLGGANSLARVNREGEVGISHSHSFTTDKSGGGKAHENRPPYYTLAYIIKK